MAWFYRCGQLLDWYLLRYLTWLGVVLWKDTPSPPKPPPAPNPSQTIQAEAAAQPSAYTPYGNVVYAGNPNVPGSFHYTETLSPSQQTQLNLKNQIAETLLNRAQGQIPNIPATPYSYRPFKFNPNNPATNQAWEAQKGLLDPYFAQQQDQFDQRMANQGIPMGSAAYNEAQRQFEQNKNAAYQQAAANAEQTGYNQAQNTYNTNYQTSLGQRQQNYNELAALLGGQQITPPAYNPSNMVDPASAYAQQQAARNLAYQGQLGQYNAQVAGNNSLMGGLFGLGGQLGSAALLA